VQTGRGCWVDCEASLLVGRGLKGGFFREDKDMLLDQMVVKKSAKRRAQDASNLYIYVTPWTVRHGKAVVFVLSAVLNVTQTLRLLWPILT
jgi:hypothetical protein